MEVRWASILPPADSPSRFQILFNQMTAFLKMINSFDSVTPFELLADDFGRLDLDPLLSHQVFSVLEHRHGIGVRLCGIEVIGRALVEHHLRLSHHRDSRRLLLFFRGRPRLLNSDGELLSGFGRKICSWACLEIVLGGSLQMETGPVAQWDT